MDNINSDNNNNGNDDTDDTNTQTQNVVEQSTEVNKHITLKSSKNNVNSDLSLERTTNLTKTNMNNNLSKKLTKNNKTNVNIATEETNVMRSLNKVAMNLLNHNIVMKLFHFQTELYGAHKASDAYLEKFGVTMDKFLEIAQGIYGKLTIKKFKLEGSSHTDENIMKHIESLITLLRTEINDVLDNYTDLINMRDELVGDAEQLKYLLTFK